MKAYRYNAKTRQDRRFNNCGEEKNPCGLRYYASNLEYAEQYRYVRYDDGAVAYECELEVVDVDANLFDMATNFKSLNTYKKYISQEVGNQLRDYTFFMNTATSASERKMWANAIDSLKNRESELVTFIVANEFQSLSDFLLQTELVAELKGLGFDGYKTKNEIVLF